MKMDTDCVLTHETIDKKYIKYKKTLKVKMHVTEHLHINKHLFQTQHQIQILGSNSFNFSY